MFPNLSTDGSQLEITFYSNVRSLGNKIKKLKLLGHSMNPDTTEKIVMVK